MENLNDSKKYNLSGMNKNTYEILFDSENFTDETKQYRNERNNKEFMCGKLSDLIDISVIEKVLKTNKKSNKCHISSVAILSMLHGKGKILTGYCIIKNKKYLHSVVELKGKDEKLYIIDYTRDIIMLKDAYIDLTEFEELETITNLEYEEDMKLIRKFGKDFNLKTYLSFRTEIMRDLNKNKKIFEEDNER